MSRQEKTMRDALGQDVPLGYVKPYDRVRDKMVRRIHKRWEAARAVLEKVHAETLADIAAIAKARGDAEMNPSEKGNMQVSSFDGNICVSVNQRYEIRLDDRVVQAREKMYVYARGLVEKVGGDDGRALFEIIKQAFEVTRSGSLSMGRVANLLKMNITHKDWAEAKALLVESMAPEKGKCYIRVERRGSRQQDMKAVRLDIADCWVESTHEGTEVTKEGQ
ncbi:MAG: DUF3164 family protein [Kiritimatiellaeota bacterium]|nr:DUF3164 family protein [Kiritimatiellota bacterium]